MTKAQMDALLNRMDNAPWERWKHDAAEAITLMGTEPKNLRKAVEKAMGSAEATQEPEPEVGAQEAETVLEEPESGGE